MIRFLTLMLIFISNFFFCQPYEDKNEKQMRYYDLSAEYKYLPEKITDLEKIKILTKNQFSNEFNKKEFEKQIDYELRLKNSDSRLKEIIEQNFTNVIQLKNTIYSASLGKYDAETESFSINIFDSQNQKINFSPKGIQISIPIEYAPYFKQRFFSENAKEGVPLIAEIKEFVYSNENFIPSKILFIFPNLGNTSDLGDDVFHDFSFNLLLSEKVGATYILSNKVYKNENKYHNSTLYNLFPIKSTEKLNKKWHFYEWNCDNASQQINFDELLTKVKE